TYVKQAWAEKAGVDVNKLTNEQLTWTEYYDMLKKMKDAYGHYVISAPGFVSDEAPYTNYLPEFFQKANYTFYKDSTGKYVDGFSTQDMQDALTRIATAVSDKVLDKESVTNTTSDARNKFKSTDAAVESGVFTYWA